VCDTQCLGYVFDVNVMRVAGADTMRGRRMGYDWMLSRKLRWGTCVSCVGLTDKDMDITLLENTRSEGREAENAILGPQVNVVLWGRK
jgi:hypothetical protein